VPDTPPVAQLVTAEFVPVALLLPMAQTVLVHDAPVTPPAPHTPINVSAPTAATVPALQIATV
jgi:hypothetical protein